MNKPLYNLIRERFQLGPANHMTHLENLDGIVQAQAIKSYNLMRGSSYHNLSNQDVQQGRAAIIVPTSSRPLHDYVPLYFGFKTPMVAWNQDKNEKIIFLRFSLDILSLPGVIFTDGNARSTATRFFNFTSVDDLSQVDSKAIQTIKYASDLELRRKKQAEILIPDSLTTTYVHDVICYSNSSAKQVMEIFKKSGIRMNVIENKGWYFTQHKDS